MKTKTFNDLALSDILVGKKVDCKGSPLVTGGVEYPIVNRRQAYVAIIDDEGHELLVTKSGVDNLFTIKN